MRLLLFACVLLLSIPCIWGQTDVQLVLAHTRRDKKVKFDPGTYLLLEVGYSQEERGGILEGVQGEYLVLITELPVNAYRGGEPNCYRDWIPLKEITAVYNPNHPRWRKFRRHFSAVAMAGGSIIIAGSTVNGLVQERVPQLSDLAIATGILSLGLAVRYLGRDKYKIGKKWKVLE